jgi:phospholipid/cholesterol/gamma-HCH transport system substrate-binding protein
MRKRASEVWVGIFVVVGILLLVLLTMKVERFQIGKEAGYLINIYFDSAAGLDKSAPVRVAGVHVGQVEKVTLENGKARVTFRLPPDIVIYKDSKAYLKSEGFLGERYVEITQGTPGATKVEPNGVIEQGASPVDVEQVLSKVSGLGDDIKEVVGPVKDLMKSIDSKKVDGMITNLDKFSGQLEGIAKDSRETIQKAKDAFASMEDIGDKVNRGEGTLGKLVSDDSVYQDVKKTVETAKEASESAKKAVESLKSISETVERGEGTLGKLLKDESLYQEAKETLQSVRGITEKVEKGEGALGKLISDDHLIKEADKTMRKIQKAAESIEEQTPITVLGTLIGIFF